MWMIYDEDTAWDIYEKSEDYFEGATDEDMILWLERNGYILKLD